LRRVALNDGANAGFIFAALQHHFILFSRVSARSKVPAALRAG